MLEVKRFTLFLRCSDCARVSTSIRFKSTAKPLSHGEYCINTVKKYDYENFLCTLLLPQEARRSVFAVRAFNVELSQVRDIVSNKTIGLMRMQFWKDTIEQIYQDNPPHSPVSFELAQAVQKHKLKKHWLNRLITAREKQLEENDKAFTSIEDVENYAEQTVASLHYLVLQCLGVENVHADHAASHIGKSQGLVTLLRGTPHNARTQRVYLPVNLLLQYGVSQEDVIRGCREQKMKDLVFDVGSAANHHITTARSLSKDVPKQAKRALLPAVICDSYLKSLQQADFDLFDSHLQRRNNWLPMLLWYKKFKRTY